MKITAQTLYINGAEYVVPNGITEKEFTALCALLLRFRRVDEIYCSDYEKRFSYQPLEYVSVRLSQREIYATEDGARAARDARNAEIAAAKLMSEPEAAN